MISNNYKEDTSYKYRWNQKELLGKILSGTLDEDLYISDLRINKTPPAYWFQNPIFRGACFSGRHKLRVDVTLENYHPNVQSWFEYCNASELIFSIKLERPGENYTNLAINSFCRYSELETVDIRFLDKLRLSGVNTAFLNMPNLKTVILRCYYQIALGGDYFLSGDSPNINVVVLDSPEVATLPNIQHLTRAPAFAEGGPGGTIYIPQSLYDHLGDGSSYDYKSATNWATVDAYGTITWAPIEGSEYELK